MEINKDYMCMPEKFLSDKELSMTSRGLAATIYAYVFDGQVKTLQELKNVLNRIDDEDVVNAAWDDLENRGYLEGVMNYFEMNKPDRNQYYLFPEALLRDERYRWISAEAKLFYGYVLDYLSMHRNLKDVFDMRINWGWL